MSSPGSGTEVHYQAPEPLSPASIRHYALAIGADPSRWLDEAFPTLICDTTQLTGRRLPDAAGYLGHGWSLPFPRPTILIRGGNAYRFAEPVRPDDLVDTTWRLDDVVERAGRDGRSMAIATTTATYRRRRDGAVLATNTETSIHLDQALQRAGRDETPPPPRVDQDDDGEQEHTGPRLPDLVRALGPVELMAYGAATWDWHRLHHDPDWARAAGFDRPVADGQLLGALLARQVLEWAPPTGRLTRLDYRNRAPVLSGSTVTCRGTASTPADDGSTTIALEVRVGDSIVVGPARAVLDRFDLNSRPAPTSVRP